ncbi:MAG: lysylphosphatidylglycerol synthase domain-containing protein [Gaiellaceae bacterium]
MKEALRKLWAWLNHWFHWIALVGVVIGLVIAVKSQWAAITELDWEGSWKTLLLSAVCFSAAPLAQAMTFWIILRLLNARAPFGEAMVIWAHSYVLRYAPSGALAVVYRVRERERVAATREQVLAAEAYEHLGSLTAGACAFLLGFAVLGSGPPWLGLAVAMPVLLLAVALRPAFLGRWAQAVLRRFRIDTPILRGRHVVLVVLVNLIAWIGTGLGLLVLLNGLTNESSPGLVWAIATYSVAYLIGFVVPFLPGGLGAREGALIAVLAPRYGGGAATGIALATRLAATVGEALAVCLIWLAYFAARAIPGRRGARPALEEAGSGDTTSG